LKRKVYGFPSDSHGGTNAQPREQFRSALRDEVPFGVKKSDGEFAYDRIHFQDVLCGEINDYEVTVYVTKAGGETLDGFVANFNFKRANRA